ncbi:MAG TPA: sulfite exporter TauE/SafE family protein [Candidatus Deferrimicrobium sp.]|nr:sulfite exporter TauE/SafE family protein [Candidatus Deferrimicrobium sp.]
MDLSWILIMIAIGVLLGVASGFTGISAVNLIVPVLILIFSLNILVSLGTSLLIDCISAGIVTYLYYRHDNVDFRMGVKMGLISFSFAILGAFIAHNIPEQILTNSFGFFQIIIGATFIYRGVKRSEEPETGHLGRPKLAIMLDKVPDKYKEVIIIIASIFLGLIGGIFGAGGGFMITFILIFLFSFESHKAVGTACLVMLFTASGGFIYYCIRGNVDFSIGSIIGIFCIVGAVLGTLIAHKLSEKYLTIALGIIIVLFGTILVCFELL